VTDRHLWAGMFLARDPDAWKALMLGLEVPRHRLHPGALAILDEPLDGPPMRLDDELALRCELTTASPTDTVWARRRRA
jgi:hypothetical protein